MNTSTLQSIGIVIIALIVVWGLYAAYVYVKISIAIQKDPRKRALLGALIDGDIPFDGPPDGLRQVARVPIHAQELELRRKHIDAHRRRDRARDAVIIMMGAAGSVDKALELVEELETKNATRPLLALPTLDDDAELDDTSE